MSIPRIPKRTTYNKQYIRSRIVNFGEINAKGDPSPTEPLWGPTFRITNHGRPNDSNNGRV